MKLLSNSLSKLLSPVSLLVCLVFLFSCSRTEPKIAFGFLELVYYPGSAGTEERFTFFVLPEDDEGIENLAELHLRHDREGLRWILTPEDWISFEEEGRIWIGSRSIAMIGSEGLPRGLYRAILINKGGEKTERTFTFDAPADSRLPFPVLKVNDDWYQIESQYPSNKFICYDAQGNAIRVISLTGLGGALSSLDIPQDARSIALWAEDPEHLSSAMTDLVSVR
ncbi:MAG: hypothetical protein LBR93_05425 [Treponema sp.]|nr:hypothetical protein [Treponema sp.]